MTSNQAAVATQTQAVGDNSLSKDTVNPMGQHLRTMNRLLQHLQVMDQDLQPTCQAVLDSKQIAGGMQPQMPAGCHQAPQAIHRP